MEGNLIIVESPEKAKTIGNFLDKKQYTVKASIGHIRDLQENSLSVDIAHGFTPEYVVPSNKKKVVAELKKLSESAQTVWLASDEDREGEAISWHLAETLKLDPAKTRRIAFHEITKTAVLDAIEHPRQIDMNLVNAQQARRVLDRLVGFELSPVLWRKIRPQLSAGRVQSVALRLIVDREKEIMDFKSKPYYRVEALFHPQGTPASVKVRALLDSRFDTLEDAEKFLQDSIGAVYSIANIDAKESARYPGAPFTTSTLQQEAARVLHFPVSTTMRVAQALYERGLITYMRTDSVTLSSLALGAAKKFIVENFGQEYSHTRQYKTRTRGAQEAHEAIRPTFIENTSINGTAQEQKLYNLIWKRTVASQMAEAKTLVTSIKVRSDRRSELYGILATQILFDGFLKVYMDPEENETGEGVILPEMHLGDILEAKGVTAECKFTAPPARYSEGTLIKKLEELEIGRPSTYNPTIATLTSSRGYVVKGDKEGVKYPVTDLVLKGDVITRETRTETVGAEKNKLLPQEIGLIVSDYLVKRLHRQRRGGLRPERRWHPSLEPGHPRRLHALPPDGRGSAQGAPVQPRPAGAGHGTGRRGAGREIRPVRRIRPERTRREAPVRQPGPGPADREHHPGRSPETLRTAPQGRQLGRRGYRHPQGQVRPLPQVWRPQHFPAPGQGSDEGHRSRMRGPDHDGNGQDPRQRRHPGVPRERHFDHERPLRALSQAGRAELQDPEREGSLRPDRAGVPGDRQQFRPDGALQEKISQEIVLRYDILPH